MIASEYEVATRVSGIKRYKYHVEWPFRVNDSPLRPKHVSGCDPAALLCDFRVSIAAIMDGLTPPIHPQQDLESRSQHGTLLPTSATSMYAPQPVQQSLINTDFVSQYPVGYAQAPQPSLHPQAIPNAFQSYLDPQYGHPGLQYGVHVQEHVHQHAMPMQMPQQHPNRAQHLDEHAETIASYSAKPESESRHEGFLMVPDPPDLDMWREKLFHVDEFILMTEEQ